MHDAMHMDAVMTEHVHKESMHTHDCWLVYTAMQSVHAVVLQNMILTEGPQSRAQPSLMGTSTTVTPGASSK